MTYGLPPIVTDPSDALIVSLEPVRRTYRGQSGSAQPLTCLIGQHLNSILDPGN
jgi:hypothetical protein